MVLLYFPGSHYKCPVFGLQPVEMHRAFPIYWYIIPTWYCFSMNRSAFFSIVSLIQGIYYLVTGIWPIFSRRTFEVVTGPKVDFWLVRTVGALIAVVGTVLTMAGVRRRATTEIALLGIGSAASLGASDTIYAAKGRIRPIYGVESIAEFALVALWLVGLWMDSRP